MVTKENYEEYILLYADGELNADEQKELEAFIVLHPEYREEMELYNMTKLTPDAAQVFVNKEQLLKKTSVKKVIILNRWWSYGIAAGVTAILFITFWYKPKPQENVVIITHTHKTTITTIAQPEPTPKQVVIVTNNVKKHLIRIHAKQSPAPLRIARITVNKNDSLATGLAYQSPMLPAAIAPIKEITIVDTEKIELINIVQPKLVSNTKLTTKKSLLETLPIDEDKKKEMENLERIVTNTLQQISVAREEIRNEGVALKVGNKELFVVRL